MSERDAIETVAIDAAPGDLETGEHSIAASVRNYLIGLAGL